MDEHLPASIIVSLMIFICISREELNPRIERLNASDSEFSEEMMEIQEDLVTIHGEMVLLKNYSSLNFEGKGLWFI